MSVKIPEVKELFKAGVYFGHQRSRTDARSSEYIYGFQNKIAVIDLEKTRELLVGAFSFLEGKAQNGAMILFVGTKLQAKDKVKEVAEKLGMPYVVERWPGGLLTNYEIVTKSIKKMLKTEADIAENKYEYLTKKERLKIEKDLNKQHLTFGGLRKLDRLPDVVFIVDASQENSAIREAKRKDIPLVAICDTNANPREIDYPILANDDSRNSIDLIMGLVEQTIRENYKAKVQANDANTKERLEKNLNKPEEKKEEKKMPQSVKETKKPEAKKAKKEKDGKN
ncbi:MAG: 30S ribosomal protein S2 [Candidatus Berkelbacteria bacterium]|nr:30S ribosomal protein S2 [Candidatus Berkelbacteria bacterium]